MPYAELGMPNPESRLKNERGLPNPESGLSNSESRLPNPESGLSNPESRLPNPESGLSNPESRLDLDMAGYMHRCFPKTHLIEFQHCKSLRNHGQQTFVNDKNFDPKGLGK